jgi:CRISPR-associated protein (TIGR03986 family)
MIPYHSNPSSRVAHAPYNFVPLPAQVIRVDYKIPGHDKYAEHTHTGYLDCILTTLTPTYTRAALNPDFFARWNDDKLRMMRDSKARETYAQFFNLDDVQVPIIPGSSLRGMTRALIEIAGYGKVRWVNDDDLIFRAVGDPSSLGEFYRSLFLGPNKASSPNVMHFDYPYPQIRGGYLKITPEGYAIQPAKQHKGETFIHVDYEKVKKILTVRTYSVYDIFVEPDVRKPSDRGVRGSGTLKLDLAIAPDVSDIPKSGLVKAKLVTSGHMGGRHGKHWHCAIYEPDPSEQLIPIPERLWRLYSQDCDISRGIPTRRIENDYDPLFYLVNDKNELIFFGPTVMFRVPYGTSPSDLVPDFIKEDGAADLAEAIFGYVAEGTKTKSLSGRVFFTDAICEPNQENIWLPNSIITPKILGSPKPTTFQHYLVQDRENKHDPDNKRQLAHYGTPTPEETVIRGHKLYWHKQDGLSVEDFSENEEPHWESDTQHTRIKPVAVGKKFSFKVYFENLTDIELGALLWVLDLPEEHHHKIGMGKPLGLGSVAIKPQLVLTDRSARYNQLLDDNAWYTGEREESDLEQFKRAFEQYIIDPQRIGQEDLDHAKNFVEVPRIKILLKMLQWPGPKNTLTGYMKIEPNEYRDRPVLPDAFHLDGSTSEILQMGKNLDPRKITKNQKRGDQSRRRDLIHSDFGMNQTIVKANKESSRSGLTNPEYIKSPGLKWMYDLAKSKGMSIEDLANSSKMLAESWEKIKDLTLKNEVFKEIKSIYQKKDWWDSAPAKNTRKIILNYYKAWETEKR